MPKTKKAEMTLEEKTAFLASLLPDDVVVKEHWKESANERFFSSWYIYPLFKGPFAGFKNFFVTEPMLALDESLSPVTVFSESRKGQAEELINLLEAGIKKKFGIEMHAFGVL